MPRYIGTTSAAQISVGTAFGGGNLSAADLYTFFQSLLGNQGKAQGAYTTSDVYNNINNNVWSTTYFAPVTSSISPTAGGTMTINGQSISSYDYVTKNGAQTISAFTNADWFTTTADTRSALILINGNLTINAGQTVIPTNRKLFTAIYVKGNLTLNGAVSMSAVASNHNGTGNSGGAVTAVNILLASGTYSGVSNPQIPSSGGAGGAGAITNTSTPGTAGTAGTTGGTGGGGGGGSGGLSTGSGGNGAAGTAFAGGSGGGGARDAAAGNGVANGGAGGNGQTGGAGGGGGGAGQPGGTGAQSGPYPSPPGSTGIGGIIVIYCTGTFSGTGAITAAGTQGGLGWNGGGGGSGGGSVTVFYGTDTSSITPTAAAGAAGATNAGQAGYAGGAGTSRKLSF
jgi:hypothetical protein